MPRSWTTEERVRVAESVRLSWARDPERRKQQSARQPIVMKRYYREHPEARIAFGQLQVGRKPSAETLRRRSVALRGRQLSEGDKQKKRRAQIAHGRLPLQGSCQCFSHRVETEKEKTSRIAKAMANRFPTRIERLLAGVVLAEFPEVRTQEPFGCYHVDAYLPPPYHLAFEADGEYWHRHPKRDAARDAYLLRKFGLPVVRLTGSEIIKVCTNA